MKLDFDFETTQYCISAKEAADLLKQCSDFPTFGSAIRKLYPKEDLKERLSSAFRSREESDFASLDRKIRNWLNGKNAPQNREDIFFCAFALGLDEKQTSDLLGVCCDSVIHYRNPKELTYAFALRNGYSYEHAVELYQSLPVQREGVTIPPTVYTTAIRRNFEFTADEADFIEFYIEHLSILGEYHNKAHSYFQHFMDVLMFSEEGEEEYSVERVISSYMNPPANSGRSRQNLDQIQKMVRRAFPNATDIRNMLAKRMDVPRKLLLLLYMVTENSFDGDYDEYDEDYISPEERFEQQWWGINLMLNDCGMPILDPQNPFDKLILYALNTEDEDESMLEKFDDIISYLFDE